MKSIAINGITFQKKESAGIERYVYQTVNYLDKIIPDDWNVYLLCPQNATLYLPNLNRIHIIRLPMKGMLRRTFFIRKFLKISNASYADLTGGICLSQNAMGCIHDIRYRLFDTYDSFIWRIRGNIDFLSYKLFASKIVTVSHKSKQEICRILKIKENKVSVIGPGWNHMDDINEDIHFWKKHKHIQKKHYYYTVASLMPHKNFKWIYENAKNNPDKLFVIAGKDIGKICKDALKNVIYLGYVSDEENKTLMKNCIAFIYPSKYEGFGIPPLEALSCGTQIMISDIKVFHEIYQGCATFFHTDDYNFDFNISKDIKKEHIRDCLKKYNWNHTAECWIKLMEDS